MRHVEFVSCPYCGSNSPEHWAEERGWTTVRCKECGYLYVNPRPSSAIRNMATESGIHAGGADLDISERRVTKKVTMYRKLLELMFSDVWVANEPVTWLDIGAGYGEMVQAVMDLANPNSTVLGLEPMKPKVDAARILGIQLISGYIDENTPRFQYASAINVFSHIYRFDEFLLKVRSVLEDGGDLLIETGDASDLRSRDQFPGELGLPDHVAFASERHLRGFLERNGFAIVSVHRRRTDNWLYSLKNLVKKILGRNTIVSVPYTSPYRSMLVRARKLPDESAMVR